MIKRKDYHLAIAYQCRQNTDNLASIAEERTLSHAFGIQSCAYEQWINHTIAMTFSMRINDHPAIVAAAKHLIKMIIRKHLKKENIKIVSISLDAEILDHFYDNHIATLDC